MNRNSFFLLSCLCLVWLELAKAENINGDQNVTGNTVGGNLTINYSSKEDIDKIVALLTSQYQFDNEQIKALTEAVTALSKDQGIVASQSELNAAQAALAQGDTTLAKYLFAKTAKKAEQPAKQGAEAFRNLGALAFLDNTQEALQAYRRATQLDPDNANGWNRLGDLLRNAGELTEAFAAYNKVLALGEINKLKTYQDQWEISLAYGGLGLIYEKQGDLDKAEEYLQIALTINKIQDSKAGMAFDYISLKNIYVKRGDLVKAEEYEKKSYLAMKSLETVIRRYQPAQ